MPWFGSASGDVTGLPSPPTAGEVGSRVPRSCRTGRSDGFDRGLRGRPWSSIWEMEPVVGIEQPMPNFGTRFDRKPTPIKRTHLNPTPTLHYPVTEGFTEGLKVIGQPVFDTA